MSHTDIDPQAAAILEMFSGLPPFDYDNLDIADYRMMMEQPSPFAPGDEVASRELISIPSTGGAREAAVYTPFNCKAPAPVLLFFHGGGFVAGKLEQHDNICRMLAAGSGAVVISTDYRLAPEHPFPAAYEDAWSALQWVLREGGAHGLDTMRIAVGGDSAGGNLAAGLAQRAAGAGIALAHQVLLYPVMQMDAETASYEKNADGYFLTRPMMQWFKRMYLGQHINTAADPRISPLNGYISSHLAPATVVAAGYDPLHDEAVAYATRLKAAGAACELIDCAGQIHGFASMLGMIDEAETVLRRCAKDLESSFNKN